MDELREKLAKDEVELSDSRKAIESLRVLNAKYAAQALELATRLRIVTEQNHKLGTALSIQEHDLLELDKECEVLKNDLTETRHANKLLTRELNISPSPERRSWTMGLGINPTVPRHLHTSGPVRRLILTKEVTKNLIREIFISRRGRVNTFQHFVAAFFTKKYASEATLYAYAVDAAAASFDQDISMGLFAAISRQLTNEELISVIKAEVKTFMDICTSVDEKEHDEATLSLSIVQIFEILTLMYPGYPPVCMERLLTALSEAQTEGYTIFYGTLFPDVEREALIGLAQSESSVETVFSTAFKELILSDTLETMQKVEDALLRTDKNFITLDEACDVIGNMDDAESMRLPLIIRSVLQHQPGFERYDLQVSPHTTAAYLRNNVCFRRGIWYAPSSSDAFFAIKRRLAQEWRVATGDLPLRTQNLKELASPHLSRRNEFGVRRVDNV
jgi:hypothetical protein